MESVGENGYSVRTVGRIMAPLTSRSMMISHVHTKDAPGYPPSAAPIATALHQFWFIDGRMMDFALDGVKWWSSSCSRDTRVLCSPGPWRQREASWVALMVLYTA